MSRRSKEERRRRLRVQAPVIAVVVITVSISTVSAEWNKARSYKEHPAPYSIVQINLLRS
jgi:hypothetical protein